MAGSEKLNAISGAAGNSLVMLPSILNKQAESLMKNITVKFTITAFNLAAFQLQVF